MRKKKKKVEEIDDNSELSEEEFDDFQIYGPPHIKKNKKREKEDEIYGKLKGAMSLLLKKQKEARPEKKEEEWIILSQVLHQIWICSTGDALLSNDPELKEKFSRVALQARTCMLMLYAPIIMIENDIVIRANLDILFRELAEVQPYMSPFFSDVLTQLDDLDIVGALVHHRITGAKLMSKQHPEDEYDDKKDMQLAIVDLATGELFWSSRYQVKDTDRKGFLPIAPFYVGCTEYRTKVENFAQGLKEGETPLMPGAAEENRLILRRAIKHLLMSFRLTSMIAPVSVITKEEEEQDET